MLVDLHSHTSESDGSFPPLELLRIAKKSRVKVLAITDHDTFAGYDSACPAAEPLGVELICGVEISTKASNESIHILAYFLDTQKLCHFRSWLRQLQETRRDRNRQLAARLAAHGMDVTIEEVNARGRSIAGRPHFAQIIVEKKIRTHDSRGFS